MRRGWLPFRHTNASLKRKLALYLAVTLTATLFLFAFLVIRHEREQLVAVATEHVNQLSEVITRSTRAAMLKNEPDYVHSIIHDVALDQKIERIRIFSKEGVIIDSTVASEVGEKIDRSAEGCSQCHQRERPLQSVAAPSRTRTFSTAEGRRMLASMEVIRNEPSCSNAACHAHPASQSVLGVLDIVYPLDEMEGSLRASGTTIVVLSLGFVLVASLFLSLFVHRMIYVPLRDLQAGAKRLAAGNLDEPIPVRNGDELGELARSFNSMTLALKSSRSELREWGETLEKKVAQRSEALRLAQAETARNEKLASVGLLAAGIAHELNNPLTGVLTFSSLMRKKVPEGSADAEDLDLVIRETKRCAAIIRRLLDFAREKTPSKQFADLNRLIEETVRIVESPAHLRDIEIRLELEPALPAVWVDADLIKQVVMNILVNAQQAIQHKGSITVSTRRAGTGVEIAVSDTGCGIPEKDMQRIFDPFFTTKGVGQGTGLGLSVSHGIVEAHGGTIEVASKVDEGTTFRVYLPLEPAAVPDRAAEKAIA
ncbi:MAG TPA: ATP-binding protein [Burkholderiales bacterium]|nr:ATP-binding protein [Burkholderiales bacterium]